MFNHDELVAQARRRYPDFLGAVVEGRCLFPLEIRIGKTRRSETYAERVTELADFRAAADTLGIAVEWRMVNDPRFGPHERPERACFAEEAAFLGTLGKAGEVRHFREDLALIRAECPALETWLPDNTRAIVEHHGVWPELLRCVRWFCANPRSALYLRQLPVEGVDTKFFERHCTILDALMLHIDPERMSAGERRFEARHGLRWEEPLVRLRFLDAELQAARGFPIADFSVPAPVFRTLAIGSVTAIVTENLRNFLSLPTMRNSIALLGAGDAASLLKGAVWLEQSRLLYWGDIDARGFAILSRMRAVYGQTESVLMDLATLETYRRWTVAVPGSEPAPSGLTHEEIAALERVSRDGLRLEQERVPFPDVVDAFARAFAQTASDDGRPGTYRLRLPEDRSSQCSSAACSPEGYSWRARTAPGTLSP